MGFRSTTDEWRDKVSEAWGVCFTRVYHWKPTFSEYRNAGMHFPCQPETKPTKPKTKRKTHEQP